MTQKSPTKKKKNPEKQTEIKLLKLIYDVPTSSTQNNLKFSIFQNAQCQIGTDDLEKTTVKKFAQHFVSLS